MTVVSSVPSGRQPHIARNLRMRYVVLRSCASARAVETRIASHPCLVALGRVDQGGHRVMLGDVLPLEVEQRVLPSSISSSIRARPRSSALPARSQAAMAGRAARGRSAPARASRARAISLRSPRDRARRALGAVIAHNQAPGPLVAAPPLIGRVGRRGRAGPGMARGTWPRSCAPTATSARLRSPS